MEALFSPVRLGVNSLAPLIFSIFVVYAFCRRKESAKVFNAASASIIILLGWLTILLFIPSLTASAKTLDPTRPLPSAPSLAKLCYCVHSTTYLCISLALLLITVPVLVSWQLRQAEINPRFRIIAWFIIIVALALLILNLTWTFYWMGRV
jgi:hypothetical protein